MKTLTNTFIFILSSAFTFILCFIFAVDAHAFTENDLGGSVQAQVGGKTFHFPALKTDIRTKVQGDLATVTVTQTFANPTSVPLNATYLFPLNKVFDEKNWIFGWRGYWRDKEEDIYELERDFDRKVLDMIQRALWWRREYVLDEDAVRILTKEEAREFWSAWWLRDQEKRGK